MLDWIMRKMGYVSEKALVEEGFAQLHLKLKIEALEDTLHYICCQETPGANATVTRMARAAQEALDGL